MGTKSETTTPKACSNPPVVIPLCEFGRQFDKLMTAQRLILALTKIEDDKPDATSSTPQGLILWEAFMALNSAIDRLGLAAGYTTDEREP